MIEEGSVEEVKKYIQNLIGEKIQFKTNAGRKKAFIREGTLEEVHRKTFLINVVNEFEISRKVSYSYVDVLTKKVEITVCDDTKNVQVS